MDITTLGAAKNYTDLSVIGAGAIRGKNCVITSIEQVDNINYVHFAWTLDNGTVQTDIMAVSNGINGVKGDKGDTGEVGQNGTNGLDGLDGISVTEVEINASNHLICTLSDGTIIDAGEIQGSGSYALPISSTTTLGGVKIDGTTINIDENGVISSVGSGGTTNYSALTNKPSINGVELTGDKSTIDLGIDIPTVTNDLTNELKSEYDQAVTDSHTHENKELLGTYTQTEANLANAVGNSHIHSNKTILDNTTASYTTAEKTKLNNIEAGAKVNIQANWEQTDNLADDYIKNKPTSLPASDVSTWAKATDKPTYSQSEIGLGNVSNVTTNDQTPTYSEASTLATLTSGEKMSIAFGKIKKAITSLISHTGDISNPHSVTKSQVGLGNVDNTSDASKPVSTATQTALNTKASTTALTVHTGNADIHVTAADKTAWNTIPKSKAETIAMDTRDYQDFVIPILNIASTYSNEFFYGKIYLKRDNAAGQQMTIINLMCGKSYNEEKAVYYMDKSQMFTEIKPCSFVYNGKKMFGIHVYISSSDYNILRVDARSTTNFGIITPVYIYNNNTSAVLNAEIYNSLTFFDGYNMPMNFYAIPKVIKSDGTATKLLSFSPVPATLTSSGTVGDIAYDTSYMYICTATNIWKKLLLGTAHEDNTDIHVTAADKTAWNGALISKADTTTVNTALDLKANLTDLDEIDRKTVSIGGFEPTRTSALWIQNAVSVPITGTEFIDMPQTNYCNTTTMSIAIQPDGNYGILYVSVESNAKYRICKQAGHVFRVVTTTSIPQTGTVVSRTTANHTGDQITITTGNTDKYLVIQYWYYTLDPETTKEQMKATITVSKIYGEVGTTQIHYLDNGNYLPLITSDTAIKSQPRNLIGKNILFIGDSITEKNYRTAKNYHDYLAEWFGFENINNGVSGTGYMDNETFGLGWYNKLLNGFYPSTGVDGIVIMGAINDRYHSVGTYGDSTTTTLFGTLKLMYEELITRYPKIPILIITSTPRRYSYGDSGNDGTLANYHGHVDAVIQMAKEYSFPCFDLYRNSGLRPWNTTNNTEYFTSDGTGVETGSIAADGVHPNSKGHKIMAQKLFEFINSGLNL